MPSLRSFTARQVVSRASSSTQLISASDLKQVFSDALLSFSPLAILVGNKSNRILTQNATNVKQSFVIALAPIGALGNMVLACKGAHLPGLKDMLGIIDEDIRDAARAVGCAALIDNAVPRMDNMGSLICDDGEVEPEEAACAVVMLEWGSPLDILESVDLIVTGRVKWRVSGDQLIDKIQEQVEWFGHSGLGVFGNASNLGEKVDPGMIELLWPAPAMSLETHPGLPMLFLGFFGSAFLAIPILASSPLLSWQSHLPSAILMGGQTLLVLGCVAATYIVKLQRDTPKFKIYKYSLGDQREWIIFDKAKSPSSFVRRPFPATPGAHLALGQHLRFKTKYVPRVYAVVTLLATVIGFVCFYLGAKSSDTKTVLIYIVLFIGANMAKGPVIQNANKPSSITTPQDFDRNPANGNPTVLYRNFTGHPPSHFHIYSKFVYHSVSPALNMQMFCFPSQDLWVVAAHAIKDAVGTYAGNRDLGEKLLQMPVYLFQDQTTDDIWGSEQHEREVEFHGFLLLTVGGGEPQDLFYTAGMEIISILQDTFHRRQLCTDAKDPLPISLLCAFVYACTRMLVSKYVAWDDTLPPIRQRGAGCLMDAIEHVTRSTSHPRLAPFADLFRAAASAAQAGVVTSDQLKQPFNDSADERVGAAWRWLTSSTASGLEDQLEHYKKRLMERESTIMQSVELARKFYREINRTEGEERDLWCSRHRQWQLQRDPGRLDTLPKDLKKAVAELKVQLQNLQQPWRKRYEHLTTHARKRNGAQEHEDAVKLRLNEAVRSADDLENKLGSNNCTDIYHPVVMEVQERAMQLSTQLWDVREHLYQYLTLEGQLNKAVGV